MTGPTSLRSNTKLFASRAEPASSSRGEDLLRALTSIQSCAKDKNSKQRMKMLRENKGPWCKKQRLVRFLSNFRIRPMALSSIVLRVYSQIACPVPEQLPVVNLPPGYHNLNFSALSEIECIFMPHWHGASQAESRASLHC